MLVDVTGDGRADLIGMGDGYVGMLPFLEGEIQPLPDLARGNLYRSHATLAGNGPIQEQA
jgi:hypothetical protein